MELLLKHGADPNIVDDCGTTLLRDATNRGLYDIVDLLLYYGVKTNGNNRYGNTSMNNSLCTTSDDIVARIRANDSTTLFWYMNNF